MGYALAKQTLWIAALIELTGQTALAACPTPLPVVVDVPGVGYYTDSTHSVRDQILFERNREALAALDRYLSEIAHMSDAFLRTDAAAGRCTVAWLTAWAQGGALLGEPSVSAQARSQRRWSAAAMALSALKVWDVASEGERVVLRSYVRRLTQAVQQDAVADRLHNNLLYWAGLVDMASAQLVGDPRLSERAIVICRNAVASLTPQGSLPLEDGRGARAIDYNGFALFPLSVIATIGGGRTPGCSVTDLQPLARYVLAHRNKTSDEFLRWSPFLRMDVGARPEALFYSYGGGFLPLVAVKLAAIAPAQL